LKTIELKLQLRHIFILDLWWVKGLKCWSRPLSVGDLGAWW